MLKSERQKLIMEEINRQQYVKVSELKDEFGVSDETIRRDLTELERVGRVHCVHGGAVLDSSSINEYHVNVRTRQNQAEKEAICKEAAKLVGARESITILGSTTTLFLGECLQRREGLTVVTNSLPIANKLSENNANEVILAGGRFFYDDQKSMGDLAEHIIGNLYVDKVFFSVAGVSPQNGIMEYNEQEMRLTRCAIKQARRRILLSDYSKFDETAFRRIADIGAVTDIVTDWRTPLAELKEYEERGIQIHRGTK